MPAPALHDLACVVHLHSLHSDGTGTVAQIARAARASGVDVVLLTDHDTLEARRRNEDGWHGSVLVLVGEEVSPEKANHYLAFGIESEIDHDGLNGDGISRAVADAGGFGFAAHPFSKGSERFRRAGDGMPFDGLDGDALEGIELWSFVTDTGESLESMGDLVRFIATPGRVVDHPPERNVREWDRLCRTRRVVAIGGLDAHQFGKRVGPFVPLRLMSYRRSFRHLRTHVLCEEAPSGDAERDGEQVYSALRNGRCYLAMDSLAPAHGFSFWAEGDGGVLPMGDEGRAGRWTLHATVPRSARLRLVGNGAPVATAEASELSKEVDAPGVYRLEARLHRHGAERTWLMSNPIYLR